MTAQNNGLENSELGGHVHKSWSMGPKEFIFKYLKYFPLVLASIGLFMVLAYIKIRYSTVIYRVQSSMLIQDDQKLTGGQGNEKFDELFITSGKSNLNNEIAVLKSRYFMERVVRNLGLQTRYYGEGKVKTSLIYPDPPFFLNIQSLADSTKALDVGLTILDHDKFLLREEKTPVHFGEVLERNGSRFSITLNPNASLKGFEDIKFNVGWYPSLVAAQQLISGLNVMQMDDQATIIMMTFESENVKLGQDVLNMMMSIYDSSIIEDKKKIQESTLRFINSQLFQLSDTLNGVQGRLRNFMVENQVFDIDQQSKTFLDKLGESSKTKEDQALKLSIVNWLINYIGDKKNTFELVPTNLGIEEPALIQLMGEYNRLQLQREANLKTTPAENPLIVGLETSLSKVRQNMYQALLNVKQALIIAGANIARSEQELQGRVTSLPGKSMSMVNIQRRQKILEELYSMLLQKKLETQIAAASIVSNSRVVEPSAGDGVIVGPDKKKIYTMYFILGLLLPVGGVALKEILQDKVSGRADVEKNTDAPILGEIGHSGTSQTLVVTQNSRRLIAEQFRIIRTNLQYMIKKKERPVIMITSSFSGEGKSFISTNMGAVMALSGKKTVIMEFDIRKPKIVSGLDLKRKMGITNYIIGKASFNELIVKVEGVDNLYVIPCGPIPPNPAEILLDPRLDELMEEVTANFEVVIMDTAPIGLVSDAATLGRFADCTLYIVRQGQTYRKQVLFIDELYAQRKLPGLCLVINDVKPEGGYYGYYGGGRYGYYSGYGYGTGSGYFEDENVKRKNIRFKGLSRLWKK
ncbi:MAG TPA: polysaccharide biosynthesis tyrosine autokinase [Puia sp.]|nr:polysaccharide biosynthesis tyrosine autokinase [Puia sp.]